MLIDIKNTAELKKLEHETGMTVEELANDIIDIHLNEKKKKEFLKRELDNLFSLYKQKRSGQKTI